jgi:hypothetical protein
MADKTYDRPPEMALKPGYEYYATFVTEKGPVRVRLFAEEAPETVNNFVFLARDGYFDGTTFHRVIENFMVQGGDPTGTGTGGPGRISVLHHARGDAVARRQARRLRGGRRRDGGGERHQGTGPAARPRAGRQDRADRDRRAPAFLSTPVSADFSPL